jgi:hypothetical protein
MPRMNKPADGASDSPKPTRPPKRSNGGADDPVNDPDAVARRAYEIYQSRGGNHGADLDDWLEAERQLRRGPSDVTGPTAPAPAKPRRRKDAENTA